MDDLIGDMKTDFGQQDVRQCGKDNKDNRMHHTVIVQEVSQ